MHHAGRDDPDLCPSTAQGESQMEKTPVIGVTQRMQPRFSGAMSCVLYNQKRIVEEYLLGLCLAHTVFIDALATVAVVPIKSFDPGPIDH
jgi:hypothetical protein